MQLNTLIITSDPYPVEEEFCPESYKEKSSKTTAPGLRSWSIINWLYNKGTNVTLGCIPSVHFIPSKPYKFPIIDIEKIDLNKYSTIICQTGHSVIDKAVSKYSGNLILDCWVPSLVEFPLCLLRKNVDLNRYTEMWKGLSTNLFNKADYFLYPHERTLGLILGSCINSNKIQIQDVISPTKFLHVPYCVPVSPSFDFPLKAEEAYFKKYPEMRSKTTLCWFGGNYPWFDFDKVLEHFRNIRLKRDDIYLLLKSFNHVANFTKDVIPTSSGVIVDNEWLPQKDKFNYLSDIDYFFILGNIGFEGIFANRTRTLDLCSLGCIVITDSNDVIGQIAEKYGLAYLVNKEDSFRVIELLDFLIKNKQQVKEKRDTAGFRKLFNPDIYYNKILDILT